MGAFVQCGRVGTVGSEMGMWTDEGMGNVGRRQEQNMCDLDVVQTETGEERQQWDRDETQDQQPHVFIGNPATALFAYDPVTSGKLLLLVFLQLIVCFLRFLTYIF